MGLTRVEARLGGVLEPSLYRATESFPIEVVVRGNRRSCAVCPEIAIVTVYRTHKDGSIDRSSKRLSCRDHVDQQYPVVLRVRVKTTEIVLKDEKPMLGDGSTSDLVPEYVQIIKSFDGEMPVVKPGPKVERRRREWAETEGHSMYREVQPHTRHHRLAGESGRQWRMRRKKLGLHPSSR
jgi:hypothetical protein